MNSQNLSSIETRNSVIVECSDDYVGLWSIVWNFQELGLEKDILERRKKTMNLIKELLEESLIQAGNFSKEREFKLWNLSTQEILNRIEKEWDNLSRDPTLGEIVWFITTEKGDKEANRLQSEE